MPPLVVTALVGALAYYAVSPFFSLCGCVPRYFLVVGLPCTGSPRISFCVLVFSRALPLRWLVLSLMSVFLWGPLGSVLFVCSSCALSSYSLLPLSPARSRRSSCSLACVCWSAALLFVLLSCLSSCFRLPRWTRRKRGERTQYAAHGCPNCVPVITHDVFPLVGRTIVCPPLFHPVNAYTLCS